MLAIEKTVTEILGKHEGNVSLRARIGPPKPRAQSENPITGQMRNIIYQATRFVGAIRNRGATKRDLGSLFMAFVPEPLLTYTESHRAWKVIISLVDFSLDQRNETNRRQGTKDQRLWAFYRISTIVYRRITVFSSSVNVTMFNWSFALGCPLRRDIVCLAYHSNVSSDGTSKFISDYREWTIPRPSFWEPTLSLNISNRRMIKRCTFLSQFRSSILVRIVTRYTRFE